MPGRNSADQAYRYGFNGMEKDDEINGEANSYTTHYRQLDTRLARWWSIDPKSNPMGSPYSTMGNSPLLYNDMLGDTIRPGIGVENEKGFQTWYKSDAGKDFYNRFGIGGSQEEVTVEIEAVYNVKSMGISYGASGMTEIFITSENGDRKQVVSEMTYNEILERGKDVSNLTTEIQSSDGIIFKVQYEMSSATEGGSTLLHETQHVRIMEYSLRMYSDPNHFSTNDQHIKMLNNMNKPGLYTQRNQPQWAGPNRIYDFNAERWNYWSQFKPLGVGDEWIDKKAYTSGKSTLSK